MIDLAHTRFHDLAIEHARMEHRPHSLLGSQRSWQHLGYVSGVSAWGYAYDGGKFTR